MAYRVEIAPAAARDLRRLPVRVREQVEPGILGLADEARPVGVRKIVGEEHAYRLRIGHYRVVYEVYDRDLLVVILRVRRRNEGTYRDL